MTIRKKVLLFFSTTVICLLGATLFFIYTLFYEYREEEFQQMQKQKITSTLKFLTQIKKADETVIQAMDRISIHEFYDEKLLIYNNEKELIYSSIDDLLVPNAEEILSFLNSTNTWLETKDELYDVIGVYVKHKNKTYFGISKAFDSSGYSKLNFLKYVLWLTFLGISLVVIFISNFLSRKITQPIVDISQKIGSYDFNKSYFPINVPGSETEVMVLTKKFNELMKRVKEATAFQKHAIHHISHELKTPIAILVSNFERMEEETDIEKLQKQIGNQKVDTKNLSEIIDLLLEISKTEISEKLPRLDIRIDELIFDVIDEISLLYPDFEFSLDYAGMSDDEGKLTVSGSVSLLKAVLMNLMINSVRYSNDKEAKISITSRQEDLQIEFVNQGPVISKNEERFLFQHFFRGENSKGKSGFGLGLVFIYKIIVQHGGSVSYKAIGTNKNVFTISLPLS